MKRIGVTGIVAFAAAVWAAAAARAGEWSLVQIGRNCWSAQCGRSVETAPTGDGRRWNVAPTVSSSALPQPALLGASAETVNIDFYLNGVKDFSVPAQVGELVQVQLSLPPEAVVRGCLINGALSVYPDAGLFRFYWVAADQTVEITFDTPLYVDASNGDDANTGYTLARAKKTLSAAVRAAQGWPVYLAPGVYAPVEGEAPGIVLTALSADAAKTVIDGGGTNRAVTLTGGQSALTGLTLRNGAAVGDGGAVWAAATATGVVSRCILRDSHATGNGGGAAGATLTLRNSLLTGNESAGRGGAASEATLINCTLLENTAADETSSATLRAALANCAIRGGTLASTLDDHNVTNPVFSTVSWAPRRLMPGSPGLGAGSLERLSSPDETDLDGLPRTTTTPDGATSVCCGCYEGSLDALGVRVNGTSVLAGAGPGWTFESDAVSGRLLLDAAGPFVLEGAATDRVAVVVRQSASVTVSNLYLQAISSPFEVEANVAVTLRLAGRNTLFFPYTKAASGAIHINSSARLTVTNAPGFAEDDACLTCVALRSPAVSLVSLPPCATFVMAGGTLSATGGVGAAAIGGEAGASLPSDAVIGDALFCGGRTVAVGGSGGAGIGTGQSHAAASSAHAVTVTGGFVEALGGMGGAGIGGGYDSPAGRLSVSGGTVKATHGQSLGGALDVADLICGYSRQPGALERLSITGGSVYPTHIASEDVRGPASNASTRVYCVTVPLLPNGPVKNISGLALSGLSGIEAVDERICLWLPSGDYAFAVDGASYRATVTSSNMVASAVSELFVIIEEASGATHRIPYAWLENYALVDPLGDEAAHLAAALASSSNPVLPRAAALLPNWKSYIAGLDPTNANDLFYATISPNADGFLVLAPNAIRSGRAYSVEVSTNLPFVTQAKVDIGVSGSLTIPSTATNEFYRLTVQVKEEP